MCVKVEPKDEEEDTPLVRQSIEARKKVYGNCSEGLAGALRRKKKKLEVYIKRLNKELAKKGGEEQALVTEKKVVLVRCGAAEAINSRRDGTGPALMSSLGWACVGGGGDE